MELNWDIAGEIECGLLQELAADKKEESLIKERGT